MNTIKLNNTKETYGWIAITVHWLVALTIFGMYPLGLYIDSLTYYDPEYRIVPDWHKSIGLLLAAAMIFRILWKTIQVKPLALSNHTAIEKVLAKLGHYALYFLVFIVLISGYMISTADGRAISVFGWFDVPALPAVIDQQEDIAGEIHFYSATGLIAMAVMHALAALKHHFIDKDITLTRMLGIKEISK